MSRRSLWSRYSKHRYGFGFRLRPKLLIFFVAALFATSLPGRAADTVTEWTLLADEYGKGGANFRTLAIMHQAMHDALNAAEPIYTRWWPVSAHEPAADGALPEAAMAAAASRVLLLLHPDEQAKTERTFLLAMGRLVPGPRRDAGVRLGDAIAHAALARRLFDGYLDKRSFAFGSGPGAWTFTPEHYLGSRTSSMRPFMFDMDAAFDAPPPELDSEVYRRDLEEARTLGALNSAARTHLQSEAAFFWAYQSSQRGFLSLAVRLLDERPQPGGAFDSARIMSQVTTALGDSAVLTWIEKERFNFWRPVTAIRSGSPGVVADPAWLPLIETPPFPEYPSGHASDCYTGSMILQSTMGPDLGPITYISDTGELPLFLMEVGMGQHFQPGSKPLPAERKFPSLAAAAQECADSRIWAGAHFRFGADEAKRLGELIAKKAAGAVSRLH